MGAVHFPTGSAFDPGEPPRARARIAGDAGAFRTRHGAAGPRLVLFCALLIAGCAGDDPATALLDDYRGRMARVLEIDAEPLRAPALSAWPRARERTLEIPAQRASLMEFLQLQQCALGPLIGARSSALGRVMQPSQRLRYELRFLRKAALCRQRAESAKLSAAGSGRSPGAVPGAVNGPAPTASRGPDADAEALALLDQVLQVKRAQLPAVIWNATLGDAALADHLALDVGPLPPERAAGAGRDATGALQQLAHLVRTAEQDAALPADWEQPWQTLAQSRFGGEARRSMALLTMVFDDVADWIEAREAQRPLCPLGRPTPRAEILRNVFTRYYAQQVQPYLADVSDQTERWLEALDTLRDLQRSDGPPGFDARVATIIDPDAVDSEWQRLVLARNRHTRAWQDVLGRCGLAPGTDR